MQSEIHIKQSEIKTENIFQENINCNEYDERQFMTEEIIDDFSLSSSVSQEPEVLQTRVKIEDASAWGNTIQNLSTVAYYCTTCGESYENDYFLSLHRLLHSNYSEHSCPTCDYRFKCLESYTAHIRFHSGAFNSLCTICGRAFENIDLTNDHIQTDHDINLKKKCSFCSKYIDAAKLSAHVGLFHSRKYDCDYCEKSFSVENDRMTHVTSHYKNIKYKCKECDKSFPFEFVLNMHVASHVRDCLCDFCGKAFTQRAHLEVHRRLHLGEKPYICAICTKSFVCAATLTAHERSIHGRAKGYTRIGNKSEPYLCKLCRPPVPFLTAEEISEHRKMVHKRTGIKRERPPERYVCDFCDKKCSQRTALRIHIRTHTGEKPYMCSICSKTFNQNAHLRIHLTTHTGQKLHKCPYCEKSFSTPGARTEHSYIHSDVKKYVCDLCQRSFMRKPQLLNHECFKQDFV